MPNKRKGLQPVPVIVVGSHYDLIPTDAQQETVTSVQSLVNEMKVKYVCEHHFFHFCDAFHIHRFEDYLDISTDLYPLNCLKAVTPEIKALKDHLCEVRSKLIEVILLIIMLLMCVNPVLLQVQPLYPRVIELIARKTEVLRVEQPKLKVMTWESVKNLVQEEVNKLLSERQLCYVLKCLTDAGVVSCIVCSRAGLLWSTCILFL